MPESKTCKMCGVALVFTRTYEHKSKRFCSVACKVEYLTGSNAANWQGGQVELVCRCCGKLFKKKRGNYNQALKRDPDYLLHAGCSLRCSRKLYHERHAVIPEKYVCKLCGKEMQALPCIARMRQFCSKRCALITNRIKQQQTSLKGNTSIELVLKKILVDLGITFIEQRPLEGLTISDFFVEPNFVIYADGDYWHNLPDNVVKDIRITKSLEDRGYRVLRFWEHTLCDSPDEVRNILQHEILKG